MSKALFRPLVAYYALTIALSWSVYLPLVAVKQGWVSWQIPFAIHYLAAFGPMLAAFIVTAATGGIPGLRELWGRMTRWRVGWKWALFSVLSPVAVLLLAMPVRRLGMYSQICSTWSKEPKPGPFWRTRKKPLPMLP